MLIICNIYCILLKSLSILCIMYALIIAFDVISLKSSNAEGLLSLLKSFLASLAIPLADAYCSKHPVFAHPQVSISFSNSLICPISPPAP